jgi:hypothetical protein
MHKTSPLKVWLDEAVLEGTSRSLAEVLAANLKILQSRIDSLENSIIFDKFFAFFQVCTGIFLEWLNCIARE